jgi:hypothetical protein
MCRENVSILVWFAAAFLLSLGGAWVTVSAFPGWWTVGGWVLVALAQGFLAWRAFVQNPPNPEE